MSRIPFHFLFNIALYKAHGKRLFFSINLPEIGKTCGKADRYEQCKSRKRFNFPIFLQNKLNRISSNHNNEESNTFHAKNRGDMGKRAINLTITELKPRETSKNDATEIFRSSEKACKHKWIFQLKFMHTPSKEQVVESEVASKQQNCQIANHDRHTTKLDHTHVNPIYANTKITN